MSCGHGRFQEDCASCVAWMRRDHAAMRAADAMTAACLHCGSPTCIGACRFRPPPVETGPFPNRFNPMAWIKDNPTIGEGTWIGAFCLIDGSGGLTIGQGCNISCGAHILTHSTARRCVTARAYAEIDYAPTVLGDHVFVGENATILMGAQIGDRCIVGAGCLVPERAFIPSESVVVGVPLRMVRRLSPLALARGDMEDCGCDAQNWGPTWAARCEEHSA